MPAGGLDIRPGRTYRLEVSSTVDGQSLSTAASTTVPEAGFETVAAASRLGPLRYRERDAAGAVQELTVVFRRSTGIGFYIVSVHALDASVASYVYDNPYADRDSSEVAFYFRELTSALEWTQSLPTDPLREPVLSVQTIQWRGLPFYGRYRAIVYAADDNVKGFFLTHSTVQELDGNFHEPALHMEGDGVGVFGSVIADTAYFEVLRGE